MLLTLMSLLDMFGGNVPPIPPAPQGGGQDVLHQKGDSNEVALRRKKLLEQDDEDWILIITQWVVENNSN